MTQQHIRNPDPRFPDRPQHPDFWDLSQIAIGYDERVEQGPKPQVKELVSEAVDFESLLYIARGRASKIAGGDPHILSAIIAGMLDGFLLGYRLHEKRGTIVITGDGPADPDGEHRRSQ